jgi:hypothetical protein
MKFVPHFEAKLEYLVRKLDLRSNGERPSGTITSDGASDAINMRRLADFRSIETTPRRAGASAR